MSQFGYELLRLQQQQSKPLVCILDNALSCELTHKQLQFFAKGLEKKIIHLPSYELNEEDRISPSPHIVATRIQTLSQLLSGDFDILLTSLDAIVYRLAPTQFVEKSIFEFKVGQTIDPMLIRKNLTRCGFEKQSQVSEPHCFAQRGEVFDIFLPQLSHPIRIVFDDHQIESIMRFDPETQRSISNESLVSIVPSFEYTPNESSDQKNKDQIITAWQHQLHKLHPHLNTILDYMPRHTQLVSFSNLSEALTQHQSTITTRLDRLGLNAQQLLINNHDIDQLSQQAKTLEACIQPLTPKFSLKDKKLRDHLEQALRDNRILFVCQNHFRYTELEQKLLHLDLPYKEIKSWMEFASKEVTLGICMGQLDRALHIPSLKQWIIPEHVLSGQIATTSNKKATKAYASHATLKIGDLMVHEDHGIGRFIGIETRSIQGTEQDLVAIAYANDDKLLFRPDLLYKMHAYHGSEQQLDQLKSDRWQKRKAKAQENIERFAASLLQEAATRKSSQLNPIHLPNEYEEFTAQFPFVDTADQHSIMQHIIADLRQPELFDRLICGDVGFGKTELALRAAFIVTMSSYQVVVVAPTTVLANQHYQTFTERFKSWPINIELLTRARSNTGENIQSGRTDIIIGTHKALHQQYKKLGLVIIDEEHRFGVKQKDSIAAFSQAHRLSLTATPIPRSLNMALSKFRKISMMSTPPKKRLPIITYVGEEDPDIIKSAIERELRRGGQAYVLVNEIKKIPSALSALKKLCPHASFGTLHGQMSTEAIERQMARFYTQSFQVLIASTIIEAGIDIANANTLIVYRADKLGLAQMHQLRGRIGRSHHQGFAYFLTPPQKKITADASMRLDAIKNHTELGAGIKLALADLEIRGAGNLLGSEQSGHVHAIGISLYTSLLHQALPSTSSDTYQTEVKTAKSLLIPQSYIEQSTLRYQFYHQIANATHDQDLIKISDELIDRFGEMPEQAQDMIQIERLKKYASNLAIKSISIQDSDLIIDFGNHAKVDSQKVIALINSKPPIQLCGPTKLRIPYTGSFYQAATQLLQKIILSHP